MTASGAHPAQPPTWERVSECPRCILHGSNLRRTLATTLIVGTVLFAINQLDVVLAGHATAATWVKIGVTYLVPFCVSNIGLLIGCRRRTAHHNGSP